MRRIWLGGGGSGEDGGHAADLAWRRGQHEIGGVGRRRAIEGREEGRGRGEWEQGARCRGVGMSGADDVASGRQNRAPRSCGRLHYLLKE
jgi:hypothetical protein